MSSTPRSDIEIIRLNPAWGVVFDDGAEEPFVLMRLQVEPGRGYSAQTYNKDVYTHTPVRVAKKVKAYRTTRDLMEDMRDRMGKIDPEAWKEVLRLRSSGQLRSVEHGGIGRHHWL